MAQDIERRFSQASEIRVEGDPDDPRLVGYAVVFDTLSEPIAGLFVEQIARGAFTEVLKTSDTRALLNHDPSLLLGRKKAETLQLEEDKRGLLARIKPPRNALGEQVLESVRRGDLDGMSFAFRVGVEQWDEEADPPVRTIIKVSKLSDVSLATYPAYPDTSVAVRALDTWIDEHSEPFDYEDEARPYPNEHACRLREPGDFEKESFRRGKREHDGKTYYVIMARLKGKTKMTEQAYRYPKADWSVDSAKSHCKEHDGKLFEPATGRVSDGCQECGSTPSRRAAWLWLAKQD